MTAVELQNGVRIRIVLILFVSILAKLFTPLASDAVISASSISGVNNFFYFAVLICSIIPSKIAWILACIVLVVSSILDLVVFFLSFIVTVRCLDEGGCIQTLPFSLVVLGLSGLIALLDLYQTWNVYLILQNKTYVASATQRLRVVLTWALPFVILTNIAMIADSEFSVFAIIPLISLPIVIFLAHKPEATFLGLMLMITLISIAATLFSVANELANMSLLIEGVLTAFGFVLLFMPTEYYTKPPLPPEPDIHILPTFTVEKSEPYTNFKASKALKPPAPSAPSASLQSETAKDTLRKRTKKSDGPLKF
jgi:hypothetical protein